MTMRECRHNIAVCNRLHFISSLAAYIFGFLMFGLIGKIDFVTSVKYDPNFPTGLWFVFAFGAAILFAVSVLFSAAFHHMSESYQRDYKALRLSAIMSKAAKN